VNSDRQARILARLVDVVTGEMETARLCEVCREVTGTTGAGIMLMSGDAPVGSLCTTDATSALIEDLQYSLGEGPCVDAFHLATPVAEPDLANPAQARWLGFAGPAVAGGVRAVFGFPMQVGAARIGALNLYRDTPGDLTAEQHADALVMADVAAQAVLMLQAKAEPGEVAAELESEADFRYIVHQASGMVSVQLNISVAQAVVRLRAYSFSHDRPLNEVAQDVVDRKLRFEDEAPHE
jgi:hypothetical protein